MNYLIIESTKSAQKAGTSKYVLIIQGLAVINYRYIKSNESIAFLNGINDLSSLTNEQMRNLK